jgi:parallel beta-helix repeat protein
LSIISISKFLNFFLCGIVFITILAVPFIHPLSENINDNNNSGSNPSSDVENNFSEVERSRKGSNSILLPDILNDLNSDTDHQYNDIAQSPMRQAEESNNIYDIDPENINELTDNELELDLSKIPTSIDDKKQSETTSQSSQPTSKTTHTKTITLGVDNPELPGKALGYTRRYSSSYYVSYASYYAYLYGPGSSDYRGWAAFDLEDLNKWDGAKVKSARLLIMNNYMYYFKTVKFNVLKTSPSDLLPSEVAQILFTESGSTGTNIGKYTLSSLQDLNHKTLKINLNSVAVSEINSILSSSPEFYTFGIGMYIANLQSGYSAGYASWFDLKLEITFDYSTDLLKTTPGKGVAVSSDQIGYLYQTASTTTDNPGQLYTSIETYNKYRSYMQWDVNKIKNLILGKNSSNVYVTKLYLRFNHFDSALSDLRIHHMARNASVSTPARLYTDCGDGTRYFGPISFSTNYDRECEWDLGVSAIKDLQKALDSSYINYFGLGMITKSTQCKSTDYGAKLVIEWSDRLSVYNVNKDTWYGHIQAGIDDANPADTLLVKNGTYPEHVIVNKRVNIFGESAENTIILNPGFSDSVRIKADNVKFAGFKILDNIDVDKNIGLLVKNCANVGISNNEFNVQSIGIAFESAENISIINNSFTDSGILIKGNSIINWNSHDIPNNNTVNGKPIIYLKDLNTQLNATISPKPGQIILANCTNFNLKDFYLNNTTAGISLGFSNNNTISNCSFERNNHYGLYYRWSSKNIVKTCNFSNNLDTAIALFNSTNNIIDNNNCSNGGGTGINLLSSNDNILKKNICQNNYNGISLVNSENNTVMNNLGAFNKNSGLECVVKPGTTAKKIPIDVAMVLDSSGSMSGQRMLDLQAAAINFVNNEFLNTDDRVAIFDFGSGSGPMQPFTVCSSYGKNVLVSKIKNLSAYGGTPLWDKIGHAVNYVSGNGSNRFPIVIALTDGGDTSSQVFSPWDDWDAGKKRYRNLDGSTGHDYFMSYLSPEYESSWYWKNYSPSEEFRYGLLNVKNVTIHSVGLSLGHENHSTDSSWRFPNGWWGGYAQYESVVNNWTTNRNSSIYQEAGTPEFNLWRVANTSGGEYFFAVSSADLDSIFQKLIKIIKSPADAVNSTVVNNDFRNNKHGIYLKGSRNVNVSKNNCSNNEYGIYLTSLSDDNLIYLNILMNNSYGLYLDKSNNITVYHNNFIKNDQHSFDNEQNIWNATYPIGGNYWDTWTTPDNDKDGFVDFPYNVSGGASRDYLPFAKLSGWENQPPTEPVVDVLPEFPKTNESILCKVTQPSKDRDNDTIFYYYDWYLKRGSQLEFIKQEYLTEFTTNLSSSVPSILTIKHDVWLCRVTPTDRKENGTSAEDQVTILNSPPLMPVIEVLPPKPYTLNNLSCKVINRSRDADNDIITYIFQWYLDSGSGFEYQPGLTNMTSNLSAAGIGSVVGFNYTLKGDIWRCIVTPFDGEVYGSTDYDDVTIMNTAPSKPAIMITPENPKTDDDLICEILKPAADVDKDNIFYIYQWFKNNGSGFKLIPELTIETSEQNATIPSNYTTKHDIWRCIITPNDGSDNGTPAQDQVKIINTGPVAIISSPINGTIFDIGDYATFNGDLSFDIDKDPLLYAWDLDYNGNGNSSNFTADVSGVNFTYQFDDYFAGYVALRVMDDDGAWDIQTIYIKVRNLPPEVELKVLPTNVSIAVRIAGEKWHDIRIRLFENSSIIINNTIIRKPGSPNDQMFYIKNITFNLSKKYVLTIKYTPDDDLVNGQINGANPCWVILNFSNGNQVKIHHTFNVLHPKTHNWSVNLTTPFLTNGLNFTAYVSDNGPDELTLIWDFGDGSNKTTSFYPNTKQIYPVSIIETQSHIYSSSGKYTVKLMVTDNHGGKTTVKYTFTIP